MTDDRLQALYDILKDAFEGGIAYGKDTDGRGRTAGDILFPLAARMEEEVQKLVKAERGACEMIANNKMKKHRLDLHDSGWNDACIEISIAIQARSRPSSPERET